ncbi:MAG TPA: hypothetical protein VL524_05920 [Gemmatimonadaceae bacterium]|nr:hypothetical protein [Gemmatimonadaceae bacterium]
MIRFAFLTGVIASFSVALPAAGQRGRGSAVPPRGDSSVYGALSYRFIGPPGNRVDAVAGIPGDPYTYFVGAASGGIWKTTDGGVHWRPIFDKEPVSSIGALAVAPSNPSVVWAGTGESFIRSHISMGWGMFRSVDAGATWRKVGLEKTGRIARIAVDPRNADVALVAALGNAYRPQDDRGIYRTTDGGQSWTRVLFAGDSAGGIDVLLDPNDPNVVYAATWQIEIHTYGRTSGGAGSGIWKSVDNGVTWRRLTGHGLPERPFGKVGLAVTKADSKRVYALIETGKGIPWRGAPTDTGVLWRSDDAGESWRLVNSNSGLLARPAYYTRMAVAPDKPDEAYFLSIGFSGSRDGGRTLAARTTAQSPGFDNHDMWIDPTNPRRMVVGNDEGVSISTDRGESWNRIRLPIAQIYHVTTDNRIPYTVCGNMQDGPSTCGPSNTKFAEPSETGASEIPRGAWYSVGGGESGWATPDPVDPNVIWSTASGRGSMGGIVVRAELAQRRLRDVEVWPVSPNGHAAKDVKYRFVWDFPIAISPHDHTKVYVGSQFVHMTTNGGQSWSVISPDLTLNDTTRQQASGGLTGDNIGVEYGDVVYAIAESPIVPGLIWAGTNDGQVQLTRNGGKSWTNVTRNIPGMIPWGTVSNVEPSRFKPGTAYITVNGHQEGNFEPWVYRTSDYGASWTLIVNGLPKSPVGYARCVREDPKRPGLLYLGTENALYVSFDDGARWEPLQLDLPHAPVSWLTVQPRFDDLVIATYGRGFYILDDITPLQQLTAAVRGSSAHLFAPRPAYRFRLYDVGIRSASDDPNGGRNPPYGASIDYWVGPNAASAPEVAILDSTGRVIAALDGPRVPGINRVMWDLRFDPLSPGRSASVPAAQPTPPRGAEEGVIVGPPTAAPQRGRGGRGGATPLRILAPPGRYTVRLRIGGEESRQPLVVLRDPDSGGAPNEIALQTAMLIELAQNIGSSGNLYANIDNIRGQLAATIDRAARLDPALGAAADSVEREFASLADSLTQQKPGAFYEWPVKLIAQLNYLASEVQSSDRPPTDQARQAHAVLKAELRLVQREYGALVQGDLARLNARLRARGLTSVVVAQP